MPPRRRSRRTAEDIERLLGPLPKPVQRTNIHAIHPSDNNLRSVVTDRLSQLRSTEETSAKIQESEDFLLKKQEEIAREEEESKLTEAFKAARKKKKGQKLTEREEDVLKKSQIKEAELKGEISALGTQAAKDVQVESQLKTRKIADVLTEHRGQPQFSKILENVRPEDFDTEQQFRQAISIAEENQRQTGATDADVLRRRLSELDAGSEDVSRAQLFLEKKADLERKTALDIFKSQKKEEAKLILKRMEENRKVDIKNAVSQLRINSLQFPNSDLGTEEGQNQFIASAFGFDPQDIESGAEQLTEEQRIGVVDFFDEIGKKLSRKKEARLLRVEKLEEGEIKEQIERQFPFRNFGSAGNLYVDLVKRKGQDEAVERFNDLAPLLGMPQISDDDTDFDKGIVNIKDVNSLFEVKLPGASSFNSATRANPNVPQATSINDDINSFNAFTQP